MNDLKKEDDGINLRVEVEITSFGGYDFASGSNIVIEGYIYMYSVHMRSSYPCKRLVIDTP